MAILTRDYLLREYVENRRSMYSIGKEMSTDPKAIGRALHDYGIPKRKYKKKKLTDEQEREICETYKRATAERAAGKLRPRTIEDIMAKYGIVKDTVYKCLKRNGVSVALRQTKVREWPFTEGTL